MTQEFINPYFSLAAITENLTRALKNFTTLNALEHQLTSIRDSIKTAPTKGHEIAIENSQIALERAYYLFAINPHDEKPLEALKNQVDSIRNTVQEDHKLNGAWAFFRVFPLVKTIVSAPGEKSTPSYSRGPTH